MKALIIIASIAAFGFFAFVMGQVSVEPAPDKPRKPSWHIVQVPPTWTGQWMVYKDVIGLWQDQTQAVVAAQWLSTNQFPPAP